MWRAIKEVSMKLFQSIVATALVAIAANMTYGNFGQQSAPVASTTETHVVQVVGKFSTEYDGYGSGSSGFLIKDGPELKVVSYDYDPMFAKMKTPRYFIVTTYANGKVAYAAIEVR